MKLMIYTQDHENYGAHDWNGEGECPQYWKAKGGSDYFVHVPTSSVNGVSDVHDMLHAIVRSVAPQIEERNEYFESTIIDWAVEADDFLTGFERSQLEYEGKITYPAKQLYVPTVVAA